MRIGADRCGGWREFSALKKSDRLRSDDDDDDRRKDHHHDAQEGEIARRAPETRLGARAELLLDLRPRGPTRRERDPEAADRHADVGGRVVEEVEESFPEERHVLQGAEGERREDPEHAERRAHEHDGVATREAPFVDKVLRGHFENRNGRGERGNEKAQVEGHRKEVAHRQLPEDGGHRCEGEPRTRIGRKPEGEDGRHDHEAAEDRRKDREKHHPGGRRGNVDARGEVAPVVHHRARTYGKREEGKPHRVQKRFARKSRGIGRKEKAYAVERPGQRQPAHDEHAHEDEKERHEDFAHALDPLFNAAEDDPGRRRKENDVAEHGKRTRRGEGFESGTHGARVRDGAVADHRLREVVDAPAAHHGVKGENEVARGDRNEPEGRPGTPGKFRVRRGGAALGASAHCHFADQERKTDRERKED